jgi:hypothetical protein
VEQKDGTISYQRSENLKETLKIGDSAGIEINTMGFEDSKTKISMKYQQIKKRLLKQESSHILKARRL